MDFKNPCYPFDVAILAFHGVSLTDTAVLSRCDVVTIFN